MQGPRRSEIKRIMKSNSEEFARELHQDPGPRVLAGAAADWPAMSRWTPEYFESRYGATPVRTAVDLPDAGIPYDHVASDHFSEMTVAEFIGLLQSPSRTNPCYLEAETVDHFAGLGKDIDFESLMTSPDRAATNDPFPPLQKLWIGSANTRSGLHFDDADNFLAQIRGRKKAFLIAPGHPKIVYPYKWNVGHSPLDPERPDLDRFPSFAGATIYEAVLEPGDVLFIPTFWWHFVQSLEPSISVNSWFSPPQMTMHAKLIARGGPGYWFELVKQFVLHGLLDREYRKPLFATDPPGQLLYRMTAGRLGDRLRNKPSAAPNVQRAPQQSSPSSDQPAEQDAGESKLNLAMPVLHAAYTELKKPYAPRDLERIEEVLAGLAEGRVLTSSDPRQRATEVLVPGLTARPFHDPADFPWLSQLEDAWQDIRDEALTITETSANFEPYGSLYGQIDHVDANWRAFYFRNQRVLNRENMASCPRTGELVESFLPQMSAGEIYFSVLLPGMHIQAHHGVMNARLTCHLGLEIPKDCSIRVATEIRTWQPGKIMMFDDTFEHEAWNRSEGRRVVLLFEIWHPELTPIEITILDGLIDALTRAGVPIP